MTTMERTICCGPGHDKRMLRVRGLHLTEYQVFRVGLSSEDNLTSHTLQPCDRTKPILISPSHAIHRNLGWSFCNSNGNSSLNSRSKKINSTRFRRTTSSCPYRLQETAGRAHRISRSAGGDYQGFQPPFRTASLRSSLHASGIVNSREGQAIDYDSKPHNKASKSVSLGKS